MEIEKLYPLYLNHPKICTDTRKVEKGAIFFALKGDNFNGNQFAEDALEKGCAYAVIDESEYAKSEKFILVDDVLNTLQGLATHHRKQFDIPFIGITGSNGKTTTKELMHAVLSKKFKTHSTKGNLNNHIGVPLTLLSMPKDTEIAIVEMGANHVGEIAELCKISQPNFGVITNIGKAHLEGFGSYEGVIKAKSELYQFIRSTGGELFVNCDDELLCQLSEGIEKITYGAAENANCNGKNSSEEHTLSIKLKEGNIQTRLFGEYNFPNAMAAVCIGQYFGVSNTNMKSALEGHIPSDNRSELINKGTNTIVLDAYNANPTSMYLAIENFSKSNAKNVVILGDMLELGKFSIDEHKAIVSLLKEKKFDKVILVGKEFSKTCDAEEFLTFPSTEEAKNHLNDNPVRKAQILIKGSRGIKLEEILEAL